MDYQKKYLKYKQKYYNILHNGGASAAPESIDITSEINARITREQYIRLRPEQRQLYIFCSIPNVFYTKNNPDTSPNIIYYVKKMTDKEIDSLESGTVIEHEQFMILSEEKQKLFKYDNDYFSKK